MQRAKVFGKTCRYILCMALQDKPSHHVKRVTLPDGKVIDVVYFDDCMVDGHNGWGTGSLYICPLCESKLVYPLDWEEVDKDCWAVEVRCPDCEWVGNGLFDQTSVQAFDEELDRGTEALVEDLRQIERANMVDDIERFSAALEQDRILPIDF